MFNCIKTFELLARVKMLTKFLTGFENSNHPLLGPTLRGLKFYGLWQSDGVNRFAYSLVHALFAILVFTQFVELWFIRSNMEMALRNLSTTMVSSVCVVKACTFVLWQKSWKDLMEYVSNLENSQLSKSDVVTEAVIVEYTKYSRRISYFYWCLVLATIFVIDTAPLAVFLLSSERDLILNGTLPNPEILSSWVPYDRSRGFGYWVTSFIHCMMSFYGGGVIAIYDSNAVVIMTFLAGQLKLLSLNCGRLFGDGNEIISADEAMKRIRDCHNHHVYLVKLAKVLNSLISPVMFLYVIICSFVICACAMQLSADGMGYMHRIWIAEYLMAIITQLFLYCWHSNEVLYMSNKVENGVYASVWWSQGVRVRRSIMLLAGQLRRPIVFSAGPFTHLTVSAFITILKGAYSYYTLLSAQKD